MIPLGCDGKNTKDNIVILTVKEHYVVHHLLWKIYSTCTNARYKRAMVLAFNMLSHSAGKKLSAREYLKFKTCLSEAND